jgi:tryptophan-rich sensory protein
VSPRARDVLALAASLGLCYLAAAVGGLASVQARDFYRERVQPAWAPPGWLFGPVWSVLYTLQGVAAWLVWRQRHRPGAHAALGWFAVQLALNALWSWLFFAWRLGALATAASALLAVLIGITLHRFQRHDRLAGALLLPYLLWVAFATALATALWRANPDLLGGP